MRTGLDQLLRRVPGALGHRRVGLLTHAAGVDARGRSAADLLAAHPDLRLVRLFAPEHGLRGEQPAGQAIASGSDGPTGLPVTSLYGRPTTGLEAALGELDAVLIDLQDIGCRYYTYPGTMRRLIAAAAAAGVPVWVLDRPNPLGRAVAGPPGVAQGLRSLVGAFPVPARHGLTIGELALLAAREEGLAADAVHVVAVTGWRPAQGFGAWRRPWVPPSPNSTGPEMAELYPGTCLFEGTNLSEGRGTPYPFRQIGAPWWDGPKMARALAPQLPVGLVARAVWFVPAASKHAGLSCQGVFLDLVPGVRRAADAAIVAATALLRLALTDARCTLQGGAGTFWLDRLTGSGELREALAAGRDLGELQAAWRAAAAAWSAGRPLDLYPDA